MSEIALREGQYGRIDAADLLVEITKQEILPPQMKKYANICVLAKKKGNGEDLNGVLITDAQTVKDAIEDHSEVNFVGPVRIWNGSLGKSVIRAMQSYADTVVVLSARTQDAKTADWGNMIVWFTEKTQNTSMDDIVALPHRGVMIDTLGDGKLLYALSHLLRDPGYLAFTTGITQSNFSGIVDLDTAKALDTAGYSYWFRARDKVWVRGFWIGKQQARSVYADRAVMYDIKQSVASLVSQGIDYNEDGLAMVEVKILTALRQNPFVINVIQVQVPRDQRSSDKVNGIVFGVRVVYETAQEVRTVVIKLTGEV